MHNNRYKRREIIRISKAGKDTRTYGGGGGKTDLEGPQIAFLLGEPSTIRLEGGGSRAADEEGKLRDGINITHHSKQKR